MPFHPLNIVLAALALLALSLSTCSSRHPVVKADFALSIALAQLTFSIGVFGLAFSTLAYGHSQTAMGDARPAGWLAAVPHRQCSFRTRAFVGRIAHWQNSTVHRRPDAASHWPARSRAMSMRQRSGEIHCLSDHVLRAGSPRCARFAGFLIDQQAGDRCSIS